MCSCAGQFHLGRPPAFSSALHAVSAGPGRFGKNPHPPGAVVGGGELPIKVHPALADAHFLAVYPSPVSNTGSESDCSVVDWATKRQWADGPGAPATSLNRALSAGEDRAGHRDTRVNRAGVRRLRLGRAQPPWQPCDSSGRQPPLRYSALCLPPLPLPPPGPGPSDPTARLPGTATDRPPTRIRV